MSQTVDVKPRTVSVVQIMIEYLPGQGVQIAAPESLDKTLLLGVLETAKAAVANQMFQRRGVVESPLVIPGRGAA